jgi:ATP-binding cassette subfamily B (MDR/TAP) protein 1
LLVFEAIKRWRQDKTTVVITHDLSQITSSDFVYVLKNGQVVEQGYRYDLEGTDRGEFREMMNAQVATGGFLPKKSDAKLDFLLEDPAPLQLKHLSRPRPDSRFVPWGSGIFDNVAELPPTASRVSRFLVPEYVNGVLDLGQLGGYSPRLRLARSLSRMTSTLPLVANDPEFDDEKLALKKSAREAFRRRPENKSRTRWDELSAVPFEIVTIEEAQSAGPPQPFWSLIRDLYPTVPHKWIVWIGVVVSLLSGSITPVFSFLLSRLMFEVSIGASHTSVINIFGSIVLGVTAVDGVLIGLKYIIFETAAMTWLTNARNACYKLILSQDKKWFDKTENSPVRMVQVLIKDGDDAGNLLSVVLGQACVVIAMVSVGLVWALIKGWQLALVGFAIVPVFAITMAVQTSLVAKCEVRNKRTREELGRIYYRVNALFFLVGHSLN